MIHHNRVFWLHSILDFECYEVKVHVLACVPAGCQRPPSERLGPQMLRECNWVMKVYHSVTSEALMVCVGPTAGPFQILGRVWCTT
jgi:hypothetical protein